MLYKKRPKRFELIKINKTDLLLVELEELLVSAEASTSIARRMVIIVASVLSKLVANTLLPGQVVRLVTHIYSVY